MGLDHASLPVILSLIDQLHDARRHLRALTRAVCEQPDTIQQAISRHMAGDSAPGEDEQGTPGLTETH